MFKTSIRLDVKDLMMYLPMERPDRQSGDGLSDQKLCVSPTDIDALRFYTEDGTDRWCELLVKGTWIGPVYATEERISEEYTRLTNFTNEFLSGLMPTGRGGSGIVN